jgi:hypothetical protein
MAALALSSVSNANHQTTYPINMTGDSGKMHMINAELSSKPRAHLPFFGNWNQPRGGIAHNWPYNGKNRAQRQRLSSGFAAM